MALDKKLLSIAAGLVFLVNCTMAQQNFVAGAIITNKGDTLPGFIDNQRWSNSPKSIQFKNEAGNLVTYQPSQIRGFFF